MSGLLLQHAAGRSSHILTTLRQTVWELSGKRSLHHGPGVLSSSYPGHTPLATTSIKDRFPFSVIVRCWPFSRLFRGKVNQLDRDTLLSSYKYSGVEDMLVDFGGQPFATIVQQLGKQFLLVEGVCFRDFML